MAGAVEDRAGLKDLLETLFAEASGKGSTTLERYIELERALLEQYQKYISDQVAVQDEVLQNFTKLMMTSWMQVVAFQRENRARVLELQSTIADAHLRFLERLADSLSTAAHTTSPGDSHHAE
jgi:hypothetical protein